MEDAATKIQVKTVLIRSAYTTAQKAGFFGWKARRALAELEREERHEDGDEEDQEEDEEKLGEDEGNEKRED